MDKRAANAGSRTLQQLVVGGVAGQCREPALGRRGAAARNPFASPAAAAMPSARGRLQPPRLSPAYHTRADTGNRSLERQYEDPSLDEEERETADAELQGRRLIEVPMLCSFIEHHTVCKQCIAASSEQMAEDVQRMDVEAFQAKWAPGWADGY